MLNIKSPAGNLAVFTFKIYNGANDDYTVSTRYATAEAIERIGGTRTGPSAEVPAADVNSDGLTVKGYLPPEYRRTPGAV